MSTQKDVKKCWLDEGLKILETQGPGMLSIDSLVIRTGKTKGFFYHHFGSREQYIRKLLEYYEQTTTLDIIQITGTDDDPGESLKKLTRMTFQLSSGLELAVRAWALYDPMVRLFQDRLDRRRLEHLKELYTASGMDEDTAMNSSYRAYSLFIGLQQLRHHHDDAAFRGMLKKIFSD